MTQYLDRHGTEVRPGDTYWSNIAGAERPALGVFFGGPNVFAMDVVVRRADGTPVYRYKGGEDIRLGDMYETQGVTRSLTQEKLDEFYLCPHQEYCRGAWKQCTLLRRATPPVDESKKRPGKTLQDYVDAIDAKKQELAAEQDRPVLGKDRNGRDVRKGDRLVDAGTGFKIVAEQLDSGEFVGRAEGWTRGWIPQSEAELVTDEKAEPLEHSAAAMKKFEEELANAQKEIMRLVADCGHGTILESACLALSQPTRAERVASNYAKFDAAVTREVAREPSFSVVTDWNDRELMAWMTGPLGVKLTCLTPADKTLDFEAIAFEWVAALRRMVDEEAGRRARAR